MQRGDLVKFKDGDVAMLVVSVEGSKAECCWRDGEAMRSGKFSMEAIEPVTSFPIQRHDGAAVC